MEVLATTTGRPRFIPTEPVVMSSATVAATATMTRSPISHNHHHHQQQQQQQVCNSNGQTSPPGAADTTIRDKTKLLQLAEKVHTRKTTGPNYTKSFRAITSAVTKSGSNSGRDELSSSVSTPTVRRTNSTMHSTSASAPPNAPVSRSKMENYKNPKLYASFSSKSSSKLTRALIKSDPAKTNIEHLVNYKNVNNCAPRPCVENSAVSATVNGKKISENGDHAHYQSHQTSGNGGSGGGGGGGLSSFITPLKALHASFHERSSKLGQTRSKLFSHHHQNKEISASSAKLLFGTTENLHSSCSSGSSSEDILSTEIIASKRPPPQKSSSSNQKQSQTPLGNKNSKNVTPSSLSSTSVIRGQLLQNGSNVNTASTNGAVPPDFLKGFRNENTCRSNNGSNNNALSNGHAAKHRREINGLDGISDRPREANEQEISSTNSANSFITPDILGGCLDAPKATSKPTLLTSSRNGNINKQEGICKNDQNYLSDELRQVDNQNNSTVGHSRGTDRAPNKYKLPVVQQHFSNKDNKDVFQKRKNIVVRMSYPNDDETSCNDLYSICNNGVGNNETAAVVDDNQVDIWPISPIMVSTVTPKNKQFAGAVPASRIDNKAEVITVTTNNYCKDDPYTKDGAVVVTTPKNSIRDYNREDSHRLNSSQYVNAANTFLSNNNNNGPSQNSFEAGGGVSHQQLQQHRSHINPLSSSRSTVPNSDILFKSDEVRQQQNLSNHHQLLLSSQNSSSITGQPLVAHSSAFSSQKPQDKAEHLHHNGSYNQTPSSHSPEATGSSTWLQPRNSSALNNINGEVAINVASGCNTSSYLNGRGFQTPTLKKAISTSTGGGVNGGSSNPSEFSSASHYTNGFGVVSSRRNNVDDNSNDNRNEMNELVARGKGTSIMPKENEEGRERNGKEMFMEAETSFSPHQKLRRSDGSGGGGGRPQTAFLSDEYACYLGFDYGNADDEMQAQQSRLHVLKLENGNSETSNSGRENGENDSVVFGATEEDKNRTMLAITTTAASGQGRYRDKTGGGMSVMSIMKGKRQEQKPITHSVSFRGTIDSTHRENFRGCLNGIAEHPQIAQSESFTQFDRKRSRSLPKSFMSVRNGLRNVLPSQWVRDGPAFDRLNDCENSSPSEEKTVNPIEEEEEELSTEAPKMRWNKLGSSSSTSASFSDRRPKSFDYAQRKAWMKLYREMEVSQASGRSSPAARISRPISKGSITHLHLKDTSSDHVASCSNLDETDDACRCEYESDGASMSAMMRSSADISETSPSLFKRFSKTFSLRFGSGSNVSKHTGDAHRKAKSKGAIGSSPDLFNRVDGDGSRDKVNGKMRKTNVKSVRGDKCQSGDSGIGMEEQQTEARQISNLRRIRSDYISPSSVGASPAISSYVNRQHANTSALAKLSLVEIPDHSWDEHNSSPNEGSVASNAASYEDLVDAKLDGDDGFSSSDEGHRSEQLENPQYYHTLPHRKHNKRRLKETESANSCGGEVPQEDNSIRGKVVREIIHTEQNYVKTLNDIVQGFLNPCRARNDLFSSRTVQNIFSNIEDILRLHVKFLEALKSKVDPTYVSKSNVGGVFTSWADKFGLYSEYCCNNPISVATVRSLVQFPQYAEFFEACRRLQMMDKLPLHGFLLRPIQRICQYHLQLNELLKHTEESHTDHQSVVEALETMKSVATKINDTQRQFESLQEIIRFQNSIDGWEGPSLVDRNSVILRKGELVKVTHGRKPKEVFVAILNKDLIYCKKDFMKKNGYVFDGRIDLNLRMWINIDSNEEDEFFGMVHNSWRIYSPERRAWILFTAQSPTEKRKWISALEKTKEDVVVDPKLREMAVVTTALADSEMMYGGGSHGHHSNTLPKSSKKSKGKPLTVTKVDSDAMLIEVGKLKRSTMYTNANPSQREGTSKFYV